MAKPIADYKVELRGFDEMNWALSRAPKVARKEIWGAHEQAGMAALRRIRPLTPVHTGRLRDSLYYEVQMLGDRFEAVVGADAPYALYAEKGRGPGGFPPLDKIADWCEAKLGDVSLAYVVARKIATRGTKGAFMFKRGMERAKGEISRLYARARDNIVVELARLARKR